MDEQAIEQRVDKAKQLFKEGYNCAQSVVLAFASDYELDEELAKRISASFGGGFGRTRNVCGAVCGATLLMGLRFPASDTTDKAAKSLNYEREQAFIKRFSSETGSIICAELLGLSPNEHRESTPSDRTDAYYKKRPCGELIGLAARCFAEISGEPSSK